MSLIWIVEDDPGIGQLIEMTVKKAGYETRRFEDANCLENGLRYDERRPDLLLLDLMLRAKNGYQILKEWKADPLLCVIPVIIISARSAETDKVKGLELGAEDYITKPFGVRELQARVRTVLRRLEPKTEKLTAGDLTVTTDSREVYVGRKRIDLTAKEYELLLYLIRHPGAAVTRETLLKEVWGYLGEGDSSRTVDSHIKTLRLKLGDASSNSRYIQTVRGTGYRMVAGEDENG